MLINENSQSYKPNFTAIKLAKTKTNVNNIVTELDIYKLTRKDYNFLRTLPDKVSVKKFYKGLSKKEYDRWHEMLELAAIEGAVSNRETLVACKNGVPCGIMTFKPGKKIYKVDAICTWAVDAIGKVPFAGKILFGELFKIFGKTSAKIIKLLAITDGPFPTEPVYKKLGFISTGTVGDNKISMEFSKSRLKNIQNNLKAYIERFEVNHMEDIPMEQIVKGY